MCQKIKTESMLTAKSFWLQLQIQTQKIYMFPCSIMSIAVTWGTQEQAPKRLKSEINGLLFFSSSPNNPIWEITDKSSKDEMQMLFRVIDSAADKVKLDFQQ